MATVDVSATADLVALEDVAASSDTVATVEMVATSGETTYCHKFGIYQNFKAQDCSSWLDYRKELIKVCSLVDFMCIYTNIH